MDLGIGGRNQNTQLFRSECADDLDRAPPAAGLAAAAPLEAEAGKLPRDASFADFSAPGVFRAKSKGLPGDLGVLAEPMGAKAPEPRPNALEAPGEASPLPGAGTELKGFDFPCEELSPPNRLEKEALRPEEEESFWPVPDVDKESLLELSEESSC